MFGDKKFIARASTAIPIIAFLISWVVVAGFQFKWFQFIPGDLGDARLNNYFLESIFSCLTGRGHSLWNLDFFYPFPFIGGFSDNLFGAAPVYLAARLFGARPDTAFQIWFLIGYLANYVAAYYAARRLGVGRTGATTAALVFAFALPVTDYANHAQLHYRFGLPLASTYLLLFIRERRWEHLAAASAWLVWQFYCSIYIAVLGAVLFAPMCVLALAAEVFEGRQGLKGLACSFGRQWREQSPVRTAGLLAVFVGLALLTGLLFYPYLRVEQLYHAVRSWSEISNMLPRPRSYLLSDFSWIWHPRGAPMFDALVSRGEHEMFFGAAPLLLALLGLGLGMRGDQRATVLAMAGAFAFVVLLTLHVHQFSLWRFVYRLPLLSAIRAVARVDLVLLLPLAVLAGIGVDQLLTRRWGRWAAALAVTLLIIEFSLVSMPVSAKSDWRQSVAEKEHLVPARLPKDTVLFFAQSSPAFYKEELDGMWLAEERGIETMNGYSGLMPPGERLLYGADCTEVPRRIMDYLAFAGQPISGPTYLRLMTRVVPIGFSGCDPTWWTAVPAMTVSAQPYTAQEIGRLSYRFLGVDRIDGRDMVRIAVLNSGAHPIAALSAVGKPIRLSWRFLNPAGVAAGGWDPRQDLPADIPAGGQVTVTLPIDPATEIHGGVLEVSLVQELVFWAHDIGVQPLRVPWP